MTKLCFQSLLSCSLASLIFMLSLQINPELLFSSSTSTRIWQLKLVSQHSNILLCKVSRSLFFGVSGRYGVNSSVELLQAWREFFDQFFWPLISIWLFRLVNQHMKKDRETEWESPLSLSYSFHDYTHLVWLFLIFLLCHFTNAICNFLSEILSVRRAILTWVGWKITA